MQFTLINPLDQPTGRIRLLTELRKALEDKNFERFQFVVAYAKSGPLLRLEQTIVERRASGLQIDAIFGLDQQGTTAQALDFALAHFNSVYVTQEQNITFHPKMYFFIGPKLARVFVGSHNLTVGGTETNFEASIQIDFTLPDDIESLKPFLNSWTELLPETCPATRLLDDKLLESLIESEIVIDEAVARKKQIVENGKQANASRVPKSGLSVKPPSALPKKKPRKKPDQKTETSQVEPHVVTYGAQGLAIQIKPHHNGEIFLSVTAALQNPAFFRWPFQGQTIPKKPGNPAYPQLSPDPIINVAVFGASPDPLLTLTDYALNTVYYATKSEIRITASPLVGVVPEYSVMIITNSEEVGIDYEIVIHTPDSPDFDSWIGACNQTMPSGGQKPRKFGWF